MQQPERRHIARAEFDHVAGRLAVVAVQRADLGLQRVEQTAQLLEQRRRRAQRQRRRHQGRLDLEAAAAGAPHAQQRKVHIRVARLEFGHQPQRALEVGQLHRRRLRVQVGRVHIGLHEAGCAGRLPWLREVGVEWFQARQRRVIGHRLHRLRQLAQVDRGGQLVDPRRLVQFAVLEAQRQPQHAQHAAGQRLAVDLELFYSPGIRVGRLDALVQAVFVIGVLALEMLGAQQQAFAPENFAGHGGFFLRL